MKNSLEIVLLFLNKLSFSKIKDHSFETEALLRKIDFKFIYLLLVFNDFLSQINILSQYLQNINGDMAKGIILIESPKNYFLEMRNHNSHKKFYEEAEKVSRNLNIKLPSVQFKNKRIKKIPKNLEKFVCDSKIIEKQPLVTENEYRSNIFYCILVKIINEFDKRFSDNSNIINGISALNPESIFVI